MALDVDPAKTALLVMDVQNDIVDEAGFFKEMGFARMVQQTDLLAKIARLQEAARSADVRLIHVRVSFRPGYPERPANGGLFGGVVGGNALIEGSWGAEIADAVAPLDGEPVISKKGVSAFYGSDLAALLANAGTSTLLLSGVATNFVVEATAREAVDRGFDVVVVGDCCTSVSQEAHEAALSVALPMLTTISDLEAVVAALNSVHERARF